MTDGFAHGAFRDLTEAGNPSWWPYLTDVGEGPWVLGPPIEHDLPDGGHVRIVREGDGTGHFWETGSRTSGEIAGVFTPGRTWIGTWHPSVDDQHPDGPGLQQHYEWGTVFSPFDHRDDEHYTHVATFGGTDDLGRSTVVTTSDQWSENGQRTQGVAVEAGERGADDYARSTSWCRQDGDDWVLTTITTDRHGDGTKTETRGHGEEAGETTTTPYHESDGTPDEGHGDPPPDHDEEGAPAGDDWGHEEGNPDGPFPPMDSVTLRRLLGPGWREHDGLDTLGNAYGALAPYLGRIRATAASGGHSKEELDALGAPPFVGITMFPVHDSDGVFELDTLGAPPPIHPEQLGQLRLGELPGVGEDLDIL
jgi:hypothetical protein